MSDNLIKAYNSIKVDDLLRSVRGQKQPKIIYHYTSPEGLFGILSDNTIWATDIFMMNDSSEVDYVLQFIEDNLKEFDKICHEEALLKAVKEEINNIRKVRLDDKRIQFVDYSISFSLLEDELSMWNYYTKGNSIQGYNIGFDAKELAKSIYIGKKGEWDKKKLECSIRPTCGKVIYNEKVQLDLLLKIFANFYELKGIGIDDDIKAYLFVKKSQAIGRFFKKECFKGEKEYRIVFSFPLLEEENNTTEKELPKTEKFNRNNGILIPYQECPFELSDDVVKRITISPTLNTQECKYGLYRFLKMLHIKPEVCDSAIPLRW